MLHFIRYLTVAAGLALCLGGISTPAAGQCLMSDTAHIHPTTADAPTINQNILNFTNLNRGGGIWYVPVSIHFILDQYGKGNFRPQDDGNGNTNYTGYDHAEILIREANRMLASNKTMLWYDTTLQGPPPTYPILIQLTLDGVYFHNDSQFVQSAQSGLALASLNSMYGKNVNSRINLFFNSNSATDSNGVPILQGIANGFGIPPLSSLIQNDWRLYTHYKTSPPTPSHYLFLSARLLLHELGHNWDLYHSWENDGCLDTHTHIWDFFQCHTNNLMDYSCKEPALTPCQLQRIYTRLIGGDLSSYVQNFGCPTTNAFFDLPDTVDISRRPISIPFIGQASWGESRYELEIFSVSGVGSTSPTNPADRFVTTRIGEVKNWNLASLYPFAGNTTYLVRLKTYYDTDTLNCTTSDVYTRYVHTLSLTNSNPTDPPQNDNRHTMERERRATTALETATPQTIGYQMNLMPNPAQNWVNIEYDLQVTPSSKPYTLTLVDALGRTAWQQSFSRHDLPPRLDLAPYLPGIYHLVLAQDQVLAIERLLILHP